MAILRIDSGCKVGWVYYDNEEEARASVPQVLADAERAAYMGYDFGFQTPGEVQATTLDGKPAWKVTIS